MAGASAECGPLHVRFDKFELDEANARLLCAGEPVALAPTPFNLLCALVARPGALLTKHALLDIVWGHRFVSDSVLKGAISDIRTVLADDPRSPRYIETVPRRGYRFVAVPRSAGSEPTPPTTTEAASRLATRGADETTSPAPCSDRPGFVGRRAELGTLANAWATAREGRRVVAWIAGEPGIGKTTLIDRFIATTGDAVCARGQCVQGFGAGEPYHAVLEALSTLARRDPSVAPLLRAVAPTWLLQLPWLSTLEQREALLRELVGVNPERMLREMGEFLDRYTEHQPMILVTEDLHWADRATIQLIEYVARRNGPARLLWLSSFRLAEVVAYDHPLDALRNNLRVNGRCIEIVLDAFTGQEIAAYLAGSAPDLASDDAFVRALQDRTDGVPLFVASVASDVTARLSAGDRIADALADIPIPQNLSALIDHYFARLNPEQRSLLGAAAICGTAFRIQTLGHVLDRDVLEVGEACDALARGQYWLVAVQDDQAAVDGFGGHYAFRHALYRQVLIDRSTTLARVELHRRVGAALEHERAAGNEIAPSELAAHFDQGRLPLPAVRYYAEASQAAIRQLRPSECLAHTERALALLPLIEPGPERAGFELTLATLRGVASFHVHGAGNLARSAFAQAAGQLAAVPDHPLRGLLLHALGFLLGLRAEYDEALLTAARAEALGDATGDALLALAASTVQGQVHNVQGRPEAARRALERALPAISSVEDAAETRLLGFIADPQVTARSFLSLPLLHLGLVRQGRDQLDLAVVRARGLGQPMSVMVALWFQALFETRIGDADRVGDLAAEMQALVDEYALAQGRTACRWFQGWAEARRGQPREGFRRIRDALDENLALGMWSGATENLSYAAEALVAAGDFEAAQAQLDEALALVERLDERICLPQLRLIESRIARGRGEPERAAAAIREAIRQAQAQGAPWLELLALIELVEHASPSPDDLSSLAALADRLDEAHGTPAYLKARSLLDAHRSTNG